MRTILPAPARSSRSPPTTATRTSCATATGDPLTAHSLNPVPLVADRPGRGWPAAPRRGPRRCRADPARIARTSRVGRDDGSFAASCDSIRRRYRSEDVDPVNPLLAFGQIIVSIALIIAILMQARGTGLSGTFGGDSAVYRSRRGVEKRLWQFTVALLVLFVAFSLVSFLLSAVHGVGMHRPPSAAIATTRSQMTRNDTAVVGALVLMLAIIAGIVGLPAIQATTREPHARRHPHRDHRRAPVSRGLGGSAGVDQPADGEVAGRSRPRRADLLGARPQSGPNGTVVPDLAARWSVDDDGKVWTFDLQPDATWHDGEPVTADDVVFTIDVLKDPAYTGPAATSWSEVTVRAASADAGDVHARDAARWFPPGGDPADRPVPPARRHPDRGAARRSLRPVADRRRAVRPGPARRRPCRTRARRPVPAAGSRWSGRRIRRSVRRSQRLAQHLLTESSPEPAGPVPARDGVPVLRRRPVAGPGVPGWGPRRGVGSHAGPRDGAVVAARLPAAALPGLDPDSGAPQPAPGVPGVPRRRDPNRTPGRDRPWRACPRRVRVARGAGAGPDPAELMVVRPGSGSGGAVLGQGCRGRAQEGQVDEEGRRLAPARRRRPR